MLEEEVKVGEQERENLRIETQRLRDELSDLKIEAEITLEKLRHAEATIAQHNEASTTTAPVDIVRPQSAASQVSATSPSSIAASTPPPSKSDASTASDAVTPPSPPLSEASPKPKPNPVTPMPAAARKRSLVPDSNTTPRPSHYSTKPPRHSRGASIPISNSQPTPSFTRRGAPTPRPPTGTNPSGSMPRSGSLYQIRGIIGKMQKLEERVHSARSKLPAPTNPSPRASPRNGSSLGHYAATPSGLPSNITVRSSRKRASGSTTTSNSGRDHHHRSSRARDSDIGGGGSSSMSIPAPPPSPRVSRLSFGGSGAGFGLPPRSESRAGAVSATGFRGGENHNGGSRPPSQAGGVVSRPSSRASTRTPLGHYATVSASRPRSSISGSYA
ncbi:MAG: hypothetical protein Q9157_001675, partial [Trypethelium eluteriae]